MAPSLQQTHWDRVVECYALLESIAPTPIHTLNRSVAVTEWLGPAAGLAVLTDFEPPNWLLGSYLWAAVLADLNRRCDNDIAAAHYKNAALELAPTDAIRQVLRRRLQIPGS